MQNTASGQPGEIPTDEELEMVGQLFSVMLRVVLAHGPFTTKSEIARNAADEMALLAM